MNFNFFLFLLVDYELYLYLFDRELNQSAAEEEELDTFWKISSCILSRTLAILDCLNIYSKKNLAQLRGGQ